MYSCNNRPSTGVGSANLTPPPSSSSCCPGVAGKEHKISSTTSIKAGIHENGSLSDGVQTQTSSGSGLPDSKVAAEDSGTGSSLESSDKDRSESMHTEPSDDNEENQMEMDSAENEFCMRLDQESTCEQDSQMSTDPPADDDMEAVDGTLTARNPGSASASPSPSYSKSNPRVPRYPSIIRTRNKRVEQQQEAEGSAEPVSGGRRSRHASGDQTAAPTKVTQAEDAARTDDANGDRRALSTRGGKRLGRGRGRGGVKRPRSLECPVPPQPGRKVKSPGGEVSPPVSAPVSKRGRSKASPAKPSQSPVRTMTRATTAEMKKVQFLSLPGRKRRRKAGQQDDEEEDEDEEERDDSMEVPLVKKNKSDEETEDGVEQGIGDDKEGEAADDKELDEEKELCEDKEDKDQSLESRGRGGYRRGSRRGRRGRGGKGVAPPTSSELKQISSEQPEEEPAQEDETGFGAKEGKPELDGASQEPPTQPGDTKGKEELKTKAKKKRGRPPRRPKEDSAPAAAPCPTVAEDDMDVALKTQPVPVSEPLKNPDQIVELLQLSETMEGGRVTPPDEDESSSPDKAVPKKPLSKAAPAEATPDPEADHANEATEDKAKAIDTEEKTEVVESPAAVEEPPTPAAEPLPDDKDKKDNSPASALSPPPVSLDTTTTTAAVTTGLEVSGYEDWL